MGGVWTRLKLAFAAFFTILFKGRLPEALQTVVTTTAAEVATATETAAATAAEPVTSASIAAPSLDQGDRAVQMLALLQRDGRLIDFLMEDLGAYNDAQIGAAARDVHQGCRGALTRYVTLEAIMDGREGEPATVAGAFDPATVRLVGNVTGQPPFRGTLLHRGWRVTRVDLPQLGSEATRRIVAQAEVEVA